MAPISTAIAGYAAEKIVQVAEKSFHKHVIERWTRHRARIFLETFCESLLSTSKSDEDIGALLDKLLSDEGKSEAVFDAYRAVCLSRSKNIGPRIIALLTAELVLAEKNSDESDDLIFSAAEQLFDSELNDFSEFAISYEKKAEPKSREVSRLENGSIEILMAKETIDSNWKRHSAVPIGPMDLAQGVGNWAPKLKQLGLISDDVREHQWRYEQDSERYTDMPGVAREITWWLNLTRSSLTLAKFVQRAKA